MKDLLTVLPIALSNLFLGAVVLFRNRKSSQNRYFFLLTLSVASWVIFNGFANIQDPSSLLWTKITFVSGLLVGLFLFFFSLRFTNQHINKLVQIIVATSTAVITGIILFTDTIVSGITYIPTGTGVSTGVLYLVFPLSVLLLVTAALAFIVIKYGKANNIIKTQIRFMLLGLIVSAVFASVTNIFFPAVLGNDSLSQFGPYAMVIFVASTTYAILKHKLMDIRMVVARSVSYAILLLTLAGFYAGSVLGLERLIFPEYYSQFNLAQAALRTSISVIMVFLFQPLKAWITKATDKVFFRDRYDADALLAEMSNTMGSTIVLIELLYKVGVIINKQMKASRVLVALIKDDSRMYTVQAVGYQKTPEVDPRDVLKMCKDGIVVADELEDGNRDKKLLADYNAVIAVPMKTEKEIVGVMLLGEKSSGDMYNQQDLSVFEILAPEMAVAIENAKSYEEISRFNTTLRQEVKRATYRLKQKNQQLTELDHAKDEFISMASHQLRTPLTAIKGYLSMLLEGDAGDIKVSQYDFINEAYSGANRMVGLINDLLNVSRMDTGRFFLEPKEMDIERVVNEEIKQLSNSAKAKGLTLELEVRGKVPHIWADETKIRQVVMNFMDNAIYYTNTGGVTVVLRHDKDNFIYEVHDTGIGVPKAQRDHMFEKFFRADNARTARPDGTGLGIYLAKRVVEDHGAEVIFDSTEGKGSVFGFKFPLKHKAIPKLASAPMPRPAGTVPAMPTASDIAAKNSEPETVTTKE